MPPKIIGLDESTHGSDSNIAVADTVRRRIPASPLQTTSGEVNLRISWV